MKDNVAGIRLDFLPWDVGHRVANNTMHLALRFLLVHMLDEKGMVGIRAGALGNAAGGIGIVERGLAGSV